MDGTTFNVQSTKQVTLGLHTYICQHSPGRILSSALASLFLILCAIVYFEVFCFF